MDGYAVTVYVVCDDILRLIGVSDNHQAVMSNAEVMAFTIIAAKLFSGHHRRARWVCKQLGYFPEILSNSRLNRRIHQIPWPIWEAVFRTLALAFKQQNEQQEYAVDSFPISRCQKNRIDKRHLFRGWQYIGWSASKRKYFCGIRAHMIVTVSRGEPVELLFRPGSESDIKVLW
jgi:Transposase DDE domain